MTVNTSRLLVVDTSVISSAGETTKGESPACSEALLSILDICHRVAMTPSIRDEWDRHLSRFSRKWWRSMAAHHKASEYVDPAETGLDMSEYSEKDREIIEKDMSLLTAALSADKIIVTRDDSFQQALAKTKRGQKIRSSITWINPVRQGSAVFSKL
jgi:hypothetical protein